LLLRYDPPGVGLEIDQDGQGELVVVHKDLPEASEGVSLSTIRALVDNIIEQEPTLLTRKKHTAALTQLLGRLYQISVEEEAATDASIANAAEGRPKEKASGGGGGALEDGKLRALEAGQAVVICGIKVEDEKHIHNGEVGTIAVVKKKGKFEVELKATSISVKADHLLMTAADSTLRVGVAVSIGGLRNHTELNGILGLVESCHHDNNRYEVRSIESQQLFRVKKENVTAIDRNSLDAGKAELFENTQRHQASNGNGEKPAKGQAEGDRLECKPGSKVELYGLRTAMCYNGQVAVVLSVDKARSRYEIKLADGSIKTVRAENVRRAE
jgi:hypothetical protein